MVLNRQNDAMSFIGWLRDAYPGDPEMLFLSARMFSDLSDRNAQDLLNTAPDFPLVIELNAENFEKHGAIPKAIAARQDSDVPASIAHFKKATEIHPAFGKAWTGSGKALLDSGKPADAVLALETAAKLAPDNPSVHPALATAYQRTDHKEDAAREFALQKSAGEKLNRNTTTLRKNVAGAQ